MSDTGFPAGRGGIGATGTDVVAPPATTPEHGGSGVKDQMQDAASTATDEGKHVSAVAGEEAQKVAAEAKQQAQLLLEDARNQLQEQSRTQRDRLVDTLTGLGDDLDRMSGQAESGLATDLVRGAAQKVRGLSGHLEGREPADLLDDVRSFARRKPGTFLLGALAAGVVAGRFARGAQKAQSSGTESNATTATSSMPSQRPAWTDEPTTALPGTPSAPAMASFPPDQPGEFR